MVELLGWYLLTGVSSERNHDWVELRHLCVFSSSFHTPREIEPFAFLSPVGDRKIESLKGVLNVESGYFHPQA